MVINKQFIIIIIIIIIIIRFLIDFRFLIVFFS